MAQVLADQEGLSSSEIASEINRLGLYTRGDGRPLPTSQISARANNYPNLFVRAGGTIRLARAVLMPSMVQTQRSEYLSFRRKFEPATVKLVIVAESPPASGKYFYNPKG